MRRFSVGPGFVSREWVSALSHIPRAIVMLQWGPAS